MTPHALDGAILFFDRRTGLNVRVENEETAHVRRVAPRVVMFGITNACNLRCDFCSRDTSRGSQWTVDRAAEVLEGLAKAGTLEVAFGGGEPFAFRGFAELVSRLRRTTSLAIHVTTNGTLLDDAIEFDQVRLSIYDGWRRAAQKLAGRRWGANVLVDDTMVERLPSLMNDLAALGASDVSLLSYVGSDPSRQLTRDVKPVLRAAPLPCRVSVCFGDRLPRLFGGDCGAGLDFVTLTSDRRLQSCSFQDVSQPIASAEDVLTIWRKRALDAPSPRLGCHRSAPATDTRGIRIWQGFSGNNSGECILVAHFEEAAKAEKMLADVWPGFEPGEKYSAPWRALFEDERVSGPHVEHGYMPEELHVFGRTFVARTDSAMADDFPELRALAWKRGARVRPGGIHEHGGPVVLYALRARDTKDAARLAATARAKTHGAFVLGTLNGRDLEGAKKTLAAFDRPFSVEIFCGRIDLTQVLKRFGRAAKARPRLATWFWRAPEAAHAFAIEAKAPVVRDVVLVDRLTKRLAIRALGYGGRADALEGEEVSVDASFRLVAPPPQKGAKRPPTTIDRGAFERALRVPLPRAKLRPETTPQSVGVSVRTTTPAAVLASLDTIAKELELELSMWVSDIDPCERAVARLLADLG